MKEQPSSAVVQATALEKLGMLSKQSFDAGLILPQYKVEENRRKIGTTHGINLILAALALFRKDRSAQIHGLLTIGNIANTNTRATLIGNAGGVDTVLHGMRQFPKHQQLQRNGLIALEKLASDHPQNQSRISASGGIDVILSNMGKYLHDTEIQNNGCLIIASLAKSSHETQKELKRKNAKLYVRKAGTVLGEGSISVVDALHCLRKESCWSKVKSVLC
jgi:hypothetical protein